MRFVRKLDGSLITTVLSVAMTSGNKQWFTNCRRHVDKKHIARLSEVTQSTI